MIKNCVICGEAFEAFKTAKTCSKKCRAENTKLARQRWITKNPEKHAECMRQGQRTYLSKPENRDAARARDRRYYYAGRKWAQRNPEARKGVARHHKAREKQARRNLEIAKLICSVGGLSK